jgi:threonine/homoserine/homoserine lactone efflux protein
MGEAFGQMLPLAVAIAANPIPISVVVLMLGGPRALANGIAFTAGWLAGIAALGTLVLILAGEADAGDDGQPSTWVNALKLALGAALVVLAVTKWQGRPGEHDKAEAPGWMGAIDAFGPVKAAGAGVALSALNPKNLLFVIAAAATEAQAGLSVPHQAIVWIVFTLLSTIGVAIPVVLYVALGERAPPLLERMKVWLIRNQAVVLSVLSLVIGAMLIGSAISGFSS